MENETYSEHLRRIIAILKVDRTPSDLRDYVVAALEASIAGAKTQIKLNLEYARIKADDPVSPWRETLEGFDFNAEAETWMKRRDRYEGDLVAIKLK